MATIEEITIIGLLVILLIFALRNHLMMNATAEMVFGTMTQFHNFMDNLKDGLEQAEEVEGINNEWRDWDKQ